MGQPGMAVNAARQAISVDANNWTAHLVLGHAYLSIRKLEAARQELELVLQHLPGHSEATYYLAETEEKSGRIERARKLFDRVMALDLAPSFLTLLKLKRALALPVISESDESIALDRKRIEHALADLPRRQISDPYGSGGFTNFYLAYQGQNDRDLQQKIAHYYLDICPDLAASAPRVTAPQKRDRFKVAILTSFLRNHTVGYLCRGLIEHFGPETILHHIVA